MSAVSLGGDTFGRDIDEATTRSVIDRALELRVNYVDTADVYGRGGGRSEEFIDTARRAVSPVELSGSEATPEPGPLETS